MVTNVCMKFNYDQMLIDKALGNFRKSDNSNKNNVWGHFLVQTWNALPFAVIASGPGERCKFPQWCLGLSPGEIEYGAF